MLDSTEQLKILVLEDDRVDKILLERMLEASSLTVSEIIYATLLEQALQFLQNQSFDVVLSDLNMPDSTGIKTLTKINEACPDAAIIAVTGQNDKKLGQQAIAEGAQDYLVKGDFDEYALSKSVTHAVQRKQAEKRITSQNQFLNNVLESLTYPFYVLDAHNYSIMMANSAARKLGDPMKTTCFAFAHSKDIPCEQPDSPCPLDEVKRTKKPAIVEHVHRDEQGNIRNFEIHAYPLFDNSGQVAQIIEYALDITGRKQAERDKVNAEAQLRQAQKMEAIGTLAGGIAHDFNNMLGAMIGYATLALQDIAEGTLAHSNLKEMLSAANRARDLVKQILTFGREGEEHQKPLQIASVVREALKTIRSSLPSEIKLQETIEATQSLVMANIIHIHQIILNLCNNASQAMAEKGGLLQVGVTDIDIERDTTINNVSLKQGRYVRLTVSDTGCGMSPETMEHIFEPFFTTKEVGKGTGMGLSVVHGTTKKCGATIGVESQVGHGTTFSVFFPRIQAEQKQPTEQLPAVSKEKKDLILLVDDEDIMVDVTKQILERLEYMVIGKTKSVEALEAFQAEPEKFDLVITDYRMPQMTGAQLAKKLMAIRSDVPIILCTGFSEDIGPEEAEDLGIKAYIMKPVTSEMLNETIRNIHKPKEVTV